MEKEIKTHEFVVSDAQYMVNRIILHSAVRGILYNKNHELLNRINKGDHILLIRETNPEDRMLIEVSDMVEEENKEYGKEPKLSEDFDPDDMPFQEFLKWYTKSYITAPSFVRVEYTLIKDLTQSEEPFALKRKI